MPKHNKMVPNGHFHKDWQRYVKTWFRQPFQKKKRHNKRCKKAIRIAPRPEKGPLRPAVQCPSFRYHLKCRMGRGFSLQELKAANINKKFARSIGIAVDHRRRNKSYESIQKNKLRLQEYMNKLILFPRNASKLKDYESGIEECKKAVQLNGTVMPIPPIKKHTKCMKLEQFDDAVSVYQSLRDARRAAKKHKRCKKKTYKIPDEDK